MILDVCGISSSLPLLLLKLPTKITPTIVWQFDGPDCIICFHCVKVVLRSISAFHFKEGHKVPHLKAKIWRRRIKTVNYRLLNQVASTREWDEAPCAWRCMCWPLHHTSNGGCKAMALPRNNMGGWHEKTKKHKWTNKNTHMFHANSKWERVSVHYNNLDLKPSSVWNSWIVYIPIQPIMHLYEWKHKNQCFSGVGFLTK